MNKYLRFLVPHFSYISWILIFLTLAAFILRGLRIIESMPGGIILFLMLLSLATTVMALLQRRR